MDSFCSFFIKNDLIKLRHDSFENKLIINGPKWFSRVFLFIKYMGQQKLLKWTMGIKSGMGRREQGSGEWPMANGIHYYMNIHAF